MEIEYLTSMGFEQLDPDTTEPQRNDVLWRQGHTALYIGDGMQAEALRTERYDAGYSGSMPGDQDGGETVVRKYPAGGWTWILRPPAQEQPEPEPEEEVEEEPAITEEDEMIALIRPDGQKYMLFVCNDKVHAIGHPDEVEAIKMFYKDTHDGKEIPEFDFGKEGAPWFKRLNAVLSRDYVPE